MKLVNRFIFKLACFVFPSKIYGKENFPKNSAVIVYNHLSFVDPVFVLKAYGKDDIHTIAKIELFKKKFISFILKKYGAIPVDRDNPSVGSLLTSINILKKGEKLSLSPEGTRNKTGDMTFLPFKSGSGLFAVKAKCPVIPVIVSNKAKPFKRVKVMVGKPFYLDEFYDKKLLDNDFAKMNDIIRKNMEQTQRDLLEKIKK